MRIKVVSDVHGAVSALRREARDADALWVCGDLLNFLDYRTLEGALTDVYGLPAVQAFMAARAQGHFELAGATLRAAVVGRESEAEQAMRAASRAQYEELFAAFPNNTLLTHGNVDIPELFADLLRPGVRHLDGAVAEVDGQRVGFIGGALARGPIPRRGEESDEAFNAKVAALPPVDVLCSHIPPALPELCTDVVSGRVERGSEALLEYIRVHQPSVAYFGHVHQPRAVRARVGRTALVNVGYFRAAQRMVVHQSAVPTATVVQRGGSR